MKTKLMFHLTLFGFLLASGMLLAQETTIQGFAINSGKAGPPDPATIAQHRVEMLTKILSLTSDQQKQALTVFTEAEISVSSIHDNMKSAHDTLATAVKNNDENGINQASATIGNLTGQMTAAEAKANATLYATLTPDQQAKFDQIETNHVFLAGADGMFIKVPGQVTGPPPIN